MSWKLLVWKEPTQEDEAHEESEVQLFYAFFKGESMSADADAITPACLDVLVLPGCAGGSRWVRGKEDLFLGLDFLSFGLADAFSLERRTMASMEKRFQRHDA